jgi:predicted ester cyclase
MADTTDPEAVVRAFFDIFNEEAPERFEEVIADDYLDYGHDPAGIGPQGARDDYENALAHVGHIEYSIDAIVVSDDRVAAVWTGRPMEAAPMHGVSLYRVVDGKIAETRHALIPATE